MIKAFFLTRGIKVEKRQTSSIWTEAFAVLLALVVALVLSAGLIAVSGKDVGQALGALFEGALGNRYALLETVVQATPLIFMGLATVVAFRGRIWNIGFEGQFFAGALATTWISLNLASLPRPILIPLLIVAALAGGAVWGLIPGYLKVRFGASEIIVTVMLNYVMQLLLAYLLGGPWRDPTNFYLQTVAFPEATNFPTFLGSRLHLGLILSLVLVAVVYVLMWRTPWGYEIRAMGDNPVATRYSGISIKRTILLVMIISGAIAGLAGGCELQGLHHRLRLDISSGYGFTGILVGLLASLNPIAVIPAALLFGVLLNGSAAMQILTGVPVALVNCIQGIVLASLLILQTVARYRIRRVKRC